MYKIKLVGVLSLFNGISTFRGYLIQSHRCKNKRKDRKDKRLFLYFVGWGRLFCLFVFVVVFFFVVFLHM